MKLSIYLTLFIICHILIGQKQYTYPEPPKDNTQDYYFGDTIVDPYQWMEDASDPRLIDWLKTQKAFTQKLANKQTRYWEMRRQIASIYNDVRRSETDNFNPKDQQNQEDYEFDWKTTSQSNSPDLRYKRRSESNYRLLIQAKDFKTNKTDHLTYEVISNDAQDLALVAISINGSDWRTGYLFNLENNTQLPDTIKNLRSGSDIQWYGTTVYYDAYDSPKEGRELLDKATGQKLIRKSLKKDAEILFNNPDQSGTNSFSFSIQKDNLILNHFIKSRENYYKAISCADLTAAQFFPKNFMTYPNEENNTLHVAIINNDSVWLSTNWNAPNGKVLLANLNQPNKLTEFVPEYDIVLKNVSRLGKGKIACTYSKNGQSIAMIYSHGGELLRKIDFPKGKKLVGFYENEDVEKTEFFIRSFYHPSLRYEISLDDLSFKPIESLSVPYDPEDLETRYITYPSKDGTMISMYITCKKNTKLNGKNPVLIYGYGGYGMTSEPSFSQSTTLFLLYGGILAVPNIRGGGAQGSDWAVAGRRLNKQNGIDDFVGAAKYLISENYTKPEKIAIQGGSHGALIVGAAMTQHPELYRAVIAEAGPMDMLRFHKYTVGSVGLNINEFGISTNQGDYENLLSYSPIHHVEKGIKYPNTLLITGDTDDRVPPLHSYKFLATLQELGDNSNLYCLFVNEGAGHGGALTGESWVEYELFRYYFLFDQLAMDFY